MSDKITKIRLYQPFVSNGIVFVEPFAFYLSEKLALAHGQMLIDSGEVEDSLLGDWQTSTEEYAIKVPQQLHEESMSEVLRNIWVVRNATDKNFTENAHFSVLNKKHAEKELDALCEAYRKLGFTSIIKMRENLFHLTNPQDGNEVYLNMTPVEVRDIYNYVYKDTSEEKVYRYNEKKPMDIQFDDIIKLCDILDAGERLDVRNFGCYGELDLHITKDGSYHREVDKDYSNLVTISTCWQGKWVDDTGDTYVTDGSLWNELARIFHYKDFSRDKEEERE